MEHIISLVRQFYPKLKASDIGSRIAQGTFWQFAGTALAKLIVLVSGIVCAHILGKTEYGELNMVRSTINMFAVFGFAGMGVTATKFIAEYRVSDKQHIGSIVLLTNNFAFLTGLIVTVAILLLANFLAYNTLNAPHLKSSIQVGAILLFVSVLNGAQQGILAGFESFKVIAINTFWGSISESIFMIIGGYYFGVPGAILGYGSGFFILYLLNSSAIRKLLRREQIDHRLSSFRKKDISLLYKFSLPAALSSMIVAPVLWIARTMLVRSSGFGELAVYEAADQWRIMILFIPAAICQVVLPILSSIVNDGNEKFWRVLRFNILLNAVVSLLLAICISLLSIYIVPLYGEGFTDPWPLVFLAASTVFNSVSTVVGVSIQSRSKMWIGLLFNIVWGIMVVCFACLFLHLNMGAKGIALAILCAYAIHAFYQFVYLRSIFVRRNGIINN